MRLDIPPKPTEIRMTPNTMRRLINFWPPFLFAGIRVTEISPDWRSANVQLKLRWHNRNYVGSHFGGNLFSMTDPMYMLMLIHLLGDEYHVWDRHASIDYMAPGRGVVHAHFHIDAATLDRIRKMTAGGEKYLPEFHVEIRDEQEQLVARVHKTLYVRRKPAHRPAAASAA
jgi:acyl-coenzyme A thioesterase PaaI-like protein